VLVVDADLRNPSVEEYLGLNREKGLVELLMGNVGLESVVRPTGINNLEILGSGLRPRNPSELLASRRIDELIGQLKQEYSYVIFDTPPVMPITDAGVLSARCDGTLIVVALEKATRKLVKEAVRHLQEMGANILGTFVTGIRSADPSYDQRYYSYYYTDKEGEDQ
jgi:capsular exopolysaccharide synthesis family protein